MLRRSVAEFCFEYANKNCSEKKQQLLEWIKMAKVFLPEDHHPSAIRFCLPRDYAFSIERGGADGSLCKDALLLVCGQGLGVWKQVLKCLKDNTAIPKHSMTGKANRSLKEGSRELDYANDHFLSLEGLGEVRATRFVRERSGKVTTRDDNEEYVYLPSSMSIRQCYAHYCHGIGYNVITSTSGTKTEENPDFIGERLQCMSYCAYSRFWKKNTHI